MLIQCGRLLKVGRLIEKYGKQHIMKDVKFIFYERGSKIIDSLRKSEPDFQNTNHMLNK